MGLKTEIVLQRSPVSKVIKHTYTHTHKGIWREDTNSEKNIFDQRLS